MNFYASNDSFLRATSEKPTIHLQMLENNRLKEIDAVERSRFDNFGARNNFMQSLHNSNEFFNETTKDYSQRLWAVVKKRKPAIELESLRSSLQSWN
jgi:hypothetical protein